MISNSYEFSTSSFLSLEKDMSLVINLLLKDEVLKKLLKYNTEDCLYKNNLTIEETKQLIHKNIKIVPKIQMVDEVENYIIISFDNFSPNPTNPIFRDNYIIFDIICNYASWNLQDACQLRPYKIAGEIDKLINGKHLTGIGSVNFLGANQLLLDEKKGGVTLMYSAIHGSDDKIE